MTEVRPLYVYHKVDDDFLSPLLDGGDAHVVALQLRVAVTDRLAILATKDGYVFLRPKEEVPNAIETKNGVYTSRSALILIA